MHFKLALFTFFFVLIGTAAFAQDRPYEFNLNDQDETLQWGVIIGHTIPGVKGSSINSELPGLENQIITEDYFANYHTTTMNPNGWEYGFFFNYITPNRLFGGYLEVADSDQGAGFQFFNDKEKFDYKLLFKYRFLNIAGFVRMYPALKNGADFFKGVYVGVGYIYGVNTRPYNITYKSGGPGYKEAFGTDTEQETQLRAVLQGKNDWGFAFQAGFKIPNAPLELELRYHIGGTDIVKVNANPYNFVNHENRFRLLQVSLKIDFEPFFKR